MSTAKKIVTGAVGVAAAAGVVAGVAALADKNTRKNIAHGAQGLMKSASSKVGDLGKKYQGTAHQIRLSSGNRKTKSKKTANRQKLQSDTEEK